MTCSAAGEGVRLTCRQVRRENAMFDRRPVIGRFSLSSYVVGPVWEGGVQRSDGRWSTDRARSCASPTACARTRRLVSRSQSECLLDWSGAYKFFGFHLGIRLKTRPSRVHAMDLREKLLSRGGTRCGVDRWGCGAGPTRRKSTQNGLHLIVDSCSRSNRGG